MMVARKHYDAAAALSCGLGVALIATRLKPVPEAISYLGALAYAWGILMVLGCLGAGVGAELRNHGTSHNAFRRRVWSVRLELIAWPSIACAALIFCIGVLAQYGLIAAATTLGWSGFVIFTCLGTWHAIHRQKVPHL